MAKGYKALSHVERMRNPECNKVYVPKNLVRFSRVLVEEDEIVDDVVRKVLKSKSVDPRKQVENLKVSDFSLANMAATGAIANLKTCTLDGTNLGQADSMISALDEINISVEE